MDILDVNVYHFPESKTPQAIYKGSKIALKYFVQDIALVFADKNKKIIDEEATRQKTAYMDALIENIHPLLELHDLVKQSLRRQCGRG